MNSVGGGRKSALSMQADGIAEVGGVGEFLDDTGGRGCSCVRAKGTMNDVRSKEGDWGTWRRVRAFGV